MDSKPNPTTLKNAQKALLSWYALYGRHHLPWRDKLAPNRAYRVLISEIMLQQTQVKAVLEHFYFLFRMFPKPLCSKCSKCFRSIARLARAWILLTRKESAQTRANLY